MGGLEGASTIAEYKLLDSVTRYVAAPEDASQENVARPSSAPTETRRLVGLGGADGIARTVIVKEPDVSER